jgi:hypothetical protein
MSVKQEMMPFLVETFKRYAIEVFEVSEDAQKRIFTVKTKPAAPRSLLNEITGFLPPDWQLAVGVLPDNWNAQVKADVVNHPTHYNSGKIEVIEVIEFIEDQKLDYHLGNTVKYIARAGKKDPTKIVEDLEKAQWYLKRKIEELKAAKAGRQVVRPNEMSK